MNLPLYASLIALCLVTEGFFSGSEIAITSADRLRLKAASEGGSRGASLALKMLDPPTSLLGTCLIGTNLSTVSGTTVAATMMGSYYAETGELLAVLFMAPTILLFGELVPKRVYQSHADYLAPRIIYPLRAASLLFSPFIFVLERIDGLVNGLVYRFFGEDEQAISREEIRLMLRAQDQIHLDEEDRDLIERVFAFSEQTVEDAMVPLVDVVAIREEATIRQAIDLMVERGHSRIPLYQGRIDRVTGVLHHRDLLFHTDLDAPARSAARPACFVPESKRAEDLFFEMKKERLHVAIAVDEYGGAVGIITREDLLEEIVGEIEDEYDRRTRQIRPLGEREWVVSARLEAEVLQEAIGFEMPDGGYETLAGFILSRLGHIPRAGEIVEEGRWQLEVTRVTDRAIIELKLKAR